MSISAFDPFRTDLYDLQMKDEQLQILQKGITYDEWPQNISKSDQNNFQILAKRLFQDRNKVYWVRLHGFNNPRTPLYLPEKYHKDAMCKAHDSIFGGHNAMQKTYLKISTSYYWPKMFQDIEKHKNFCLICQQWKKSANKKTPLAPLPILECPNLWIHTDLFDPKITADSNKKFELCISDAFTKYAVVTAITNKDAETVADAIYKEWISKFGIPEQIPMDGGKEFKNKHFATLFQPLSVRHMKASPAHPQCNLQVEVFNKMVK